MTDPIVTFLEERLDTYLEDLRTLVGIDSGSLDKIGVNAVNDWFEEHLADLGFTVKRYPQERFGDNLRADLKRSGKGRILLLGHGDTVFPRGTASERPMSIEGDKILGPGVCDMKAGLLTGLYAVEALSHSSFNDFERITFLSVSDEEQEDRASIALITEAGRASDAALTLEAARANGDIVTARKGVRWYNIEAFGHMAHAGVEPEKGRNAILAMAHHIVALNKLNDSCPGATVNVGVIEGGSAPNIVPDHSKMTIDVRAFSEEDFQTLENAIQAQLKEASVPDVRLVLTKEGPGTPPMPHTPGIAALETLAQKAARDLGFEVKGARTGGGSDAAFVAAAGTPALDGLGPIGGLDHSPDEYIERSSIVPRTALVAKLITSIAQREKE